MTRDDVGAEEQSLIELYEQVEAPLGLWSVVHSRTSKSAPRQRRSPVRFALGIAIAGLALVVGVTLHNGMGLTPHAAPAASRPSQDVFPIPFPDQSGFPSGTVLHHSGGPYIPQQAAARAAVATLGCSVGTAQTGYPGTHCDSVSVTFFTRYEEGWNRMGPGWGFVNAWGPDREVYYVTVHGTLKWSPKTLAASTIETDHWNVQVDATTGQVMSTGTSGAPLP